MARYLGVFCGLTLLLGIFACVALSWHVKGLTLDHVSEIFHVKAEDSLMVYTVWNIRLPRVLLAILLGGALAVAGCLLQGITRNPLADPEIIGINQGASLFVVLGLLLLGTKDVSFLIIVCAFCGAIAGGSVVYMLSLRSRFTPTRMVLAGIAVSLFFSSVTTGLLLMNETTLSNLIYWMAGKLSGAEWADIRLSVFVLLPVIVLSWLLSPQLNVLLFGDDVAGSLGQNVKVIRRIAMLMVGVLVGGAVALAGPIGFVGLMVPHMGRMLWGHDYRIMVPLSALLGANLLLASDLVGQMLFYPVETPVGILTALLGIPFFLTLMQKKKGEVL
ncbi:iron ABC transporter permease [Paenibacillus sp. SYP-B3998]|uniref:Iron ABC transporter permease n=1 Tax=Paenibacillus sp. SYP-B3998 TaxID=2678564 RepID=A0A6G3ZTH4_9BACL|nr:iron ABC transporter permease [Paenibacillus sp. SYP-B3998]NEW05004.1 iron ABC transporter permease [Paenibacillus sp. SYP-B3998]